jgi:hypothetical protein
MISALKSATQAQPVAESTPVKRKPAQERPQPAPALQFCQIMHGEYK